MGLFLQGDGPGFDARGTPGPGCLVAEELTPDATVRILAPTKVTIPMDPGPTLMGDFFAPGRGSHVGEFVPQLSRAGLPDQGQQPLFTSRGNGGRLGHQVEFG